MEGGQRSCPSTALRTAAWGHRSPAVHTPRVSHALYKTCLGGWHHQNSGVVPEASPQGQNSTDGRRKVFQPLT